MYVPEIIEVKDHLEQMKSDNLLNAWELPYENLLTRRSAAIFFIEPKVDSDAALSKVWSDLAKYDNFSFRPNSEKKLSQLSYRVTFSKEELEKNSQLDTAEVNG